MEETTSNPFTEWFYWLIEWIAWTSDYVTFQLNENPDLLGIPYGSYIFAILLGAAILAVLWMLLSYSFHMLRLYFMVIFTPWGRFSRIVSHVDGDTVKVEPAEKDGDPVSIRLIGVDTPESRRSKYMKIAPFGKEAANYTKSRLLRWQRILVIYDKAKLDKFGRELAYLYLPNGEFFNATLLKEGYGWASHYKPQPQIPEIL